MNIPQVPFQRLEKQIIRQGDTNVPSGANVVVHYTGYFLDGRVFDSSVQRNQPFQFQLGRGMIISGWDQGVSTMKKGEICYLYIPSYLAYGTRGVGPIPPNTDLIFQVELLGWM